VSRAPDRRLLWLLAAMALLVAMRYIVFGEKTPEAVVAVESVPAAEKRLERTRELASMIPGKEEVLKKAAADLALREKGVIEAETSAQAQAQLVERIRRSATLNGFDARGVEQFSEAKPLGNDYGVVSVTMAFACGVEQLVNFLADLANSQELIATNEIQITGTNDKKKTIQVRLNLSGVVTRKLVPVKTAGI
jgi:hypothetical protein